MNILKVIISQLLLMFASFSLAIPIQFLGPSMMARNHSVVEFAVLYEAAGYRHDLFYEFADTQGFIATNDWHTGGAHNCGFCSYPSVYGSFELHTGTTDRNFQLRLEINRNGLNGAIRSGAAYLNPDNLIHNWFANAEGLDDIGTKFNLNISHESFAITTLINHYSQHAEISSLLSAPATRFIGFEDIMGGGDRDYNDIIFAFNGIRTQHLPQTTITEPPTILLFSIIFILVLFKKLLKSSYPSLSLMGI